MLAGTLAITGVGIYGIGGFSAFHSKDAILEASWARGTDMAHFAFWMGAFAALLTSFYSWRLVFLTFFGKPRWAESEHIQHAVHHGHDEPEEANPPAQEDSGHDAAHHVPASAHGDGTAGYHPHESPWSMLLPLGVLSLGAVFAGFIFQHPFLEDAAFWGTSIFTNEGLSHAMHAVPMWVKLTATIVMLIGFAIAWLGYIRDTDMPERAARQLGPVYRFVYHKWYFDELYDVVFVRPAFWLGRLFWRGGDVGIIDRFGPDGAAWAVAQGTLGARRVQSGFLNTYALWMLVGLVAAVTWVIL
jgi:NADH-quinone oxidoreductase subunit L